MADYEEYLISDMQTGKFIGKEPWLAPADGWPTLVDAYVDKGILKRRLGYSTLMAGSDSPVVGIGSVSCRFYNEIIYCKKTRGYRLYPDGSTASITDVNIWTGGNYDYFWFQEYNGFLYMCNSINAVFKYVPNVATSPPCAAMNTGDVTIQSCRMMFSYKNRLIFISPKIGDVWYHNYMYYTDVNTDNVGTNNFVIAASPSDIPVTGGYISDVPVIFCANGNIYHIAYTYNADAPFTWEKRSCSFGAQARMGVANFKDNLAIIGTNRLLVYDRYQPKEYDLTTRGILNQFSLTKIVNSYSCPMKARNALINNESIYTLYTIPGDTNHSKILIYNIAEGNFAEFSIAAHSLFSFNGHWSPSGTGFGNGYSYPLLDTDYKSVDLAGTIGGSILSLNSQYAGSATTTIDIRSAQFNPFQKNGLKAKMGWLKILTETSTGVALNISLHKNYSDSAFKTFKVFGSSQQEWLTLWTDGEVGDCFQIRITGYQDDGIAGGTMDIHGLLLGFKPASKLGRQMPVYEGQIVG